MSVRSTLDSAAAASERELTTILEGIGEGFYAVDRDWRITRFNNASAQHFGIAAETVLGRNLWDVFPSARDTAIGRQFLATMETRQPASAEIPSVLVAGRWLAYRLFPLAEGIGVVFQDVTDRKHAEAHRELLINELNHRVKNTLATVQSIAAQTLRNAGVEPQVQRTLEARLLTLSNVHTVLTDQNWDSAGVEEVVWAALRPHSMPERQRFSVAGPTLRLRPKSAVALSMALHEMCTNAIKYGALSVETGRVGVQWTISDARFRLTWQEQDGPPVAAPSRKGFGSRLIERGLAAELRGAVKIDYRPAGVVYTVDAPLDAIRDEEAGA